jgi:hypothetical protein
MYTESRWVNVFENNQLRSKGEDVIVTLNLNLWGPGRCEHMK